MDERTVSIRDPETFHIVDESGRSTQGCDQDWFGSEWQRISGCGPTATSAIGGGFVDFEASGPTDGERG